MISLSNLFKKEYRGWIIYKITNPNGQVYIGATHNLKRRVKVYKKNIEAARNQRNLYKSIQKWGFDNHEVKILYRHMATEPLDINLLKITEQLYIANEYLFNNKNLLNIAIDGVNKNWRDSNPIKI